MEVRVGLVFTTAVGVEHREHSRLTVDVCIAHGVCATVQGTTLFGADWKLDTPVRLAFRHQGLNTGQLPLPKRLKGTLPDWWNRKTIPDKKGAVHQYWDRSGKLMFVGYSGNYYQL